MKRKRSVALVLAIVLVGLLGLSFPTWHFIVTGWLAGQAFYAGKPTAYWSEAIQEDQDEAKRALGRAGPEAVPVLLELLRDDQPEVRHQAVLLLSGVTPPPPALAPALQGALEQETDSKCFFLEAAVLTRLDRPAAALALARSLRSNHLPESLKPAVGLFKDLGPDARVAVPVLQEALSDPDPLTRLAAAGALLDIERPHADLVEPLRGLVRTLEPPDRVKAIRLISQLGALAEPAVPDLLEALNRPEPEVRREAAVALGKTATRSAPAVAALSQALTDQNGYVRTAAVQALVALGEPAREVLPALTEALADPHTRYSAAGLLGTLDASAAPALPALRKYLQDPDPWFRLQVAGALWRITRDGDGVLPVLRQALQQPDLHLRQNALVLAGEMGPEAKDVVPAVLPQLRDADQQLRVEAVRALSRIDRTSPNAVGASREALNDPEPAVKKAASQALSGRE